MIFSQLTKNHRLGQYHMPLFSIRSPAKNDIIREIVFRCTYISAHADG